MIQLSGVNYRRTRTLIPGFLGKLADNGHLRALFQRQDAFLVFQQDNGLLRRSRCYSVVSILEKLFALPLIYSFSCR